MAQLAEVFAAGQEFVHIRLVTGVPNKRVIRRVEHSVQSDGEFHHPQVRPEVTTRLRDFSDEELTNVCREGF